MIDYWITEICRDSNKNHIEKLRLRENIRKDGKDSVGNEVLTRHRLKIIELINSGYTYYTIYKENGEWQKGALLIEDPAHPEFLKTDDNCTVKDNLENLPEFC